MYYRYAVRTLWCFSTFSSYCIFGGRCIFCLVSIIRFRAFATPGESVGVGCSQSGSDWGSCGVTNGWTGGWTAKATRRVLPVKSILQAQFYWKKKSSRLVSTCKWICVNYSESVGSAVVCSPALIRISSGPILLRRLICSLQCFRLTER